MTPPPHHGPAGRFRNPWRMASGDKEVRRKLWRVALQLLTDGRPTAPDPSELPLAVAEPTHPTAVDGEVRVTWIGHSSTLIQLPGLNLLTDPVWSERASPFSFLGPKRFVPPPVALDALPPIQAVLLSHDHYDHLDRRTVEALHDRLDDAVTWLTPLGYREWFASLGVSNVVERDWWEDAPLPGGRFRAVAVPARHWTRRRPGGADTRLWCGWVVAPVEEGPRVWFAGDSGYCPAFSEIGERLGPFDVSLVPIGGYEPRWFMGPVHMNPEEAVQSHRDGGGRGAFIPIHWGTFALTFEPPLEPPVRLRRAWADAGLADGDLRVLRHGETVRLV